jgi:imidazoleglycerol-phosphate dehydratase/histidinol-phosphatase
MNFKLESRSATISRKTNETDIYIHLNLDGTGKAKETGIAFLILDCVMDKWT